MLVRNETKQKEATAIKTALKVALYDFFDGSLAPLNGQFMEKVNHYNRTKHKDFLMEPSVKFVLVIIDSVSQKKMGLKYKKKIWTPPLSKVILCLRFCNHSLIRT